MGYGCESSVNFVLLRVSENKGGEVKIIPNYNYCVSAETMYS